MKTISYPMKLYSRLLCGEERDILRKRKSLSQNLKKRMDWASQIVDREIFQTSGLDKLEMA
jgi:hypothetical protein